MPVPYTFDKIGSVFLLKKHLNYYIISGVSPITLGDVTSGYNIGKNISVDQSFNQLLGFTEENVFEMIEYYRNVGLIKLILIFSGSELKYIGVVD